jgi:ribulose-phosphate 3-epimerase
MSSPSAIAEQIHQISKQTDITIVGIDGPTASGKTILANTVGELLMVKHGYIAVQYFRLDWLLKERGFRESELDRLGNLTDEFRFEAEDHMNLDIIKNFLVDIRLNKENQKIPGTSIDPIILTNLYSREDNGLCTGKQVFQLAEKNIIICEGHYTSCPEIAQYLDLNICLLGDKEVLLQRKIDRVKDYRCPDQAIDYFWKIDVPSFGHHLRRHINSVDLFIDNTDYNNPGQASRSLINDWCVSPSNSLKICDFEVSNKTIYNEVFKFASSYIAPGANDFSKLLQFSNRLDNLLLPRVGFPTTDDSLELTRVIENELIHLSATLSTLNIVKISDSLVYDEYFRILPHSLSIKSVSPLNECQLIFETSDRSSKILIFWPGGSSSITKYRQFTSIDNSNSDQKIHIDCIIPSINEYSQNSEASDLYLYIPTDYIRPSFLNDLSPSKSINVIYTGNEHRLKLFSNILSELPVNKDSVIVHRFATFLELFFYKKILFSLGYEVCSSCNYLIAIKSNDKTLKKSFRRWLLEHTLHNSRYVPRMSDYDSHINNELFEAHLKVDADHSFNYYGSFIYKKSGVPQESVLSSLRSFLLSPNRHLRKRAYEFIISNYPGVKLSLSSIIRCFDSNFSSNNTTLVPLKNLHRLLPTIFAEIYLWSELRGDKSAILGANVYDIDGADSLDISGLAKSLYSEKKPIVFQSSLNALGQLSGAFATDKQGYLRLEDGSKSLIDSVLSCVLLHYNGNSDYIPLYGIGLDHIDSKSDIPKGRSSDFLDKALSQSNITHVVLDGSSLFSAESSSITDLKKAYSEVSYYEACLIRISPTLFLVDLEFCIGEMNYVESSNNALIPQPWEISYFADRLANYLDNLNLSRFNCRPSLFIANVGTTHHSQDTNAVDASITRRWVDYVKSKNFVSSVLHGTTGSSSSILTDSLAGCHKVNIAGDLLEVYCNSLVESLYSKYSNFTSESKLIMHELRGKKSLFSSQSIDLTIRNVQKKSQSLLSTLKSPSLTARDHDYFHRSSYFFGSLLVELILSSIKDNEPNSIDANRIIAKDPRFSASMIEVPFDETYYSIVDKLIDDGLKHFHIDVGDGNLISRSFSGLDKLNYLTSHYPNISTHVHLMVVDPLGLHSPINYVDQYAKAGANAIAIHPRSLISRDDLSLVFSSVRYAGCNPGIIVELSDDLEQVWNLLNLYAIEWVVIMGVPIGYGGQFFNAKALKSIETLRKLSIQANYPLLIEVDGGLTFDNIFDCVLHGASLLAGWSIIRASSPSEVSNKYRSLTTKLTQ